MSQRENDLTREGPADPLELVGLSGLMERSRGGAEIVIALVDGPVAIDHPAFTGTSIRELHGKPKGACERTDSLACKHGTFVAGILSARRNSGAPAICPACPLLLRPIFAEANGNERMPSATPEELAEAIVESVNAGARVINLSSSLAKPSQKAENTLKSALDYAAKRGVIIVAAAGNEGIVGSSAVTRHPWVLPVAACDIRGTPLTESNLGHSIGMRGLTAPGDNISSLGTNGGQQTLGGTSAAAPFVTGAIALLWSEFPGASPTQIRLAVLQSGTQRRGSIVPPLLNMRAAYQTAAANIGRRVQ
jgi:subtilisin family serine protease